MLFQIFFYSSSTILNVLQNSESGEEIVTTCLNLLKRIVEIKLQKLLSFFLNLQWHELHIITKSIVQDVQILSHSRTAINHLGVSTWQMYNKKIISLRNGIKNITDIRIIASNLCLTIKQMKICIPTSTRRRKQKKYYVHTPHVLGH